MSATAFMSVVTLALLATACSMDDARSPTVVRDSAGVRIIENSVPAWPEHTGWRLASEPSVDIGVREGTPPYQLFDVVGAQRLEDGRIVIANAGSSELRFFDADGTHLVSVGGEGGGPGEFTGMMSLTTIPGDSMLVFDWSNQRVTYFDATGAMARAVRLEFLPPMGGFPMIVEPFDDGSLLVGVRTYFSSGEYRTGLSRDEIVYVRATTDGRLIDTLAIRPGGEMHFMTDGNGRILGDRPFGRYPQHAVYEGGFFAGSSDRYEIDYRRIDGRLDHSIRRVHTNMEVTDADVERYTQERFGNAADARQRQISAMLLADDPFPEFFPAYRDIKVDTEGNLWVAEYRRPGDDYPRWTVFDPTGRMLGEVATPLRFTIYHIGANFVLGTWRDDVDIEHVLLFELRME